MRQGIKARGTRSKKRVEGFKNIEQEMQDLKAKQRQQAKLELTHSGRKSKQLVQIIDGQYAYDTTPLLENLNLTIFKGDKIGLIGPNGTGKTTLISIIQGDLELKAGSRKVLDNLTIRCFSQKRDALNLELTPVELIADGMDMLHTPHGEIHVNSYLQRFLFSSEQINRPIAGLSGGEKNRLQLALFMKESADLWIFDEPTNDLDIETIQLLEEQLTAYSGALIIIGHDRAFLDAVCSKSWLIHNHQVEEFTGGFSQVAPFIEQLNQSEKELPSTTTSAPPKKQSERAATKKKKLTYKQQKRLASMEDLILEQEERVTQLEQELADFDFSNMNEEKKELYGQLNKQKEQADQALQALYLEWEELESISS
jgi:ATP-binding cassette subfamily F protein uup